MSSCVQIDNVLVAPLASQPLMAVVNPNSHTWRSEFNEQFEAVTFSWYPDSDSPVLNLNTPSLELPIRNTNIPIELYSTSRLQSFEMVRDEEEIVSSFESSDVDTLKDCVDMFGNGMDGVAVVSPEQECKRVGEVMPSIDLGSTSISNRDCADAAYFSITSVSSELIISMSSSPTECELNVGDEVVLMEINTYVVFEREAREFFIYPSRVSEYRSLVITTHSRITNIVCITHIYRRTLRNTKLALRAQTQVQQNKRRRLSLRSNLSSLDRGAEITSRGRRDQTDEC